MILYVLSLFLVITDTFFLLGSLCTLYTVYPFHPYAAPAGHWSPASPPPRGEWPGNRHPPVWPVWPSAENRLTFAGIMWPVWPKMTDNWLELHQVWNWHQFSLFESYWFSAPYQASEYFVLWSIWLMLILPEQPLTASRNVFTLYY